MTDDELARRLVDEPAARRELSAVEVAELFLARIDRAGALNAFVTTTPGPALADARRADEARERGAPLPLDGLPLAVKDNIDVAGVVTTSCSRAYEHVAAATDAPVVRRLREAGAVVLGKTSLHELAFGATSDNPPPFGPVRNPWDAERTPGGSSGGSGAALAADLCVAALGTDTGGSVRIPASLNGVSGLRPTYGSVPNAGARHVAWTLDTIGPMARGVDDLALLLPHLLGYDAGDPTSTELAPPPDAGEPLRIALPARFYLDVDPAVAAAVRAAAEALAGLGHRVEEADVPGDERLCASTATIIRCEALALHRARFDERPDGFGHEIADRFALGARITGEELAAAYRHLHEWQRDLRAVFTRFDVVLSPTTSTPAPRIGEAGSIEASWALTYLTYPWSLAQAPALSVPCGVVDGLPVGLQLAAARGRDAALLRLAADYQRATGWHRVRPDASCLVQEAPSYSPARAGPHRGRSR
jgi:aspartyl-tRNA(Asn)/glutamyl-tRNA(Gln) amidotransferase subunit A